MHESTFRCPGCALPIFQQAVCEHCGAPWIAPDRYGVARMLGAKGTAPASLGAAITALTDDEIGQYQNAWRAQLTLRDKLTAIVAELLDIAAADRVLRDDCAEAMHKLFPVGNTVVAALDQLVVEWQRQAQTSGLAKATTVAAHDGARWVGWVHELAELACARVADQPIDALQFWQRRAFRSLDVAAAVAELDWRARKLGRRRRYQSLQEPITILRSEAQKPDANPEVVAALATQDPSIVPAHQPTLAAGLTSSNPPVRLACALALGDEATLREFANADDHVMASAAKAKLVEVGSSSISSLFMTATDAEKLELMSEMRRNGIAEAQLDALLPLFTAANDDLKSRAVGAVTSNDRRNYSATGLERIAAWAASLTFGEAAATLDARLKLCAWVIGDVDGPAPPRTAPHVASMIDAVGELLPPCTPKAFESLRFNDGLSWWLILIDPQHRDCQHVCDQLLRRADTAELVLSRMLELAAQRQRRDHRDHGVFAIWQSWWPMWWTIPTFVAGLAAATQRERSFDGRDAMIDWIWQRFCDMPAERKALFDAFVGWRRDLLERRDKTPRDRRPGGESAQAHYAVWAPLDLDKASDLVAQAVAMLGANRDSRPLIDAVAAVATDHAPDIRGLLGMVKLGYQVEQRSNPSLLAIEQTQYYLDQAHKLEEMLAAPQTLDRDLNRLLDDLRDIMRRLKQRLTRIADDKRRDAEREAEEARRVREREQQRLATERMVAEQQAEVARMQAEIAEQQRAAMAQVQAQVAEQQRAAAVAVQAALAAQTATTPVMSRWAMPVPAKPIDFEPLFPDAALITLADYARIMVRMSRGGAPAAIFADHGLDATGFSLAAQQFSMLFGTRPDLAMRFSELLTANWLG